MRERVSLIIIRDNKILFVEQMVDERLKHVFIGGGVEDGENPEDAALRELSEEANIKGKIMFGPAILTTDMIENIFIVNIENFEPTLGCDPELPLDKQQIKRFVWLDSIEETNKFNSIDKKYFSAIVAEAKSQNVKDEWVKILVGIITYNTLEYYNRLTT